MKITILNLKKRISFGSQYNEIGRKIGENLIKNYGFSSPMIQFVSK